MADISDVEQAIANTITAILYPAGADQASIVGVTCRVYRGWPNAATLNVDLNAGVVNISITTDNDSGRTTTRYLPVWRTTLATPGVSASAINHTITIAGNPVKGDVVGALIKGSTYAYRIQTGDTTDLVASNLNQLIRADHMAHVSRSTITLSDAGIVRVRVVCDGTTSFESRRQEKEIRVICWCPSPPARDLVVSAIDAGINQLSFVPLQDDTEARVVYRNTASYDQAQNALLYRRDLVYMVEYPTIRSVQLPSMLFGASEVDGNITYG